MDKDLIAMIDCPEIQKPVFATKNDYPNSGEDVDYVWLDNRSPVCIPTLKWLLREIEVTEGCVVLGKEITGSDVVQYWAKFAEYGIPDDPDTFNSPNCDSPEKALIHVFMWQKGKVWKDGEWVKR